MTANELLEKLTADNGGIVRTADVVAARIPKPCFYQYVRDQALERVAHGIYAVPDAWIDTMYLLHIRSPQAIFSHDTALYLHDLTDREPLKYSITVKTGYNPSRLSANDFKVYTVKKELHGLGTTKANTPFGHTVPVSDMERTICDIIRSRSSIEIQSFQDALKEYAKRKDKNLRQLMQYAEVFHVDKILRNYLEVPL